MVIVVCGWSLTASFNSPQVLATLNNMMVGLVAYSGEIKLSLAQRPFGLSSGMRYVDLFIFATFPLLILHQPCLLKSMF